MSLFGKKKQIEDGVTVTHYEGLPSFQQDFPCQMKVENGCVVFSNNVGSTVTLNTAQIVNVEWLQEKMYMGKYHNNPVSTSRTNAVKWYAVIHYTSSGGEEKYISFWSLNSKEKDYLLSNIELRPQNITL